MEARLVPVLPGQGTETSWQDLSVFPNKYEGKIRAQGGYYRLEMRGFTNTGTIYTKAVERVGVGEIILVAGQSNTMVEGPFASDERCLAVNFAQFSSEAPTFITLQEGPEKYIYPSVSGRAFMGPLGDLLVQRLNVPVMFMCAGAGGTNSGQWYGSTLNDNQPYFNLKLALGVYAAKYGLRGILWHQGESNSIIKYDSKDYKRDLENIILASRQNLNYGNLSWMVARVSYAKENQTGPNPQDRNKQEYRDETITGQNRVINEVPNVFAGPNTDLIEGYKGSADRVDGVHFSLEGFKKVAQLWLQSMDNGYFYNSQPYIAGITQVFPQFINFVALGDQYIDTEPISLQAFASSGLPVTFSVVSGPASIINNKIYFTGSVGQVVVEARQKGNEQYAEASPSRITFNIVKYNQFVNFANIGSQIITNKTVTLNATASSGLAIGYEIVSGPAALNGNQLLFTGGVGLVTVKAIQYGNEKFNRGEAIQSFHINKASQSIVHKQIVNQSVDAQPISLIAETSSSLTPVYEILSGPATIQDGKIVLSKMSGKVIYKISQVGNDFYEPISNIYEFEVNKYSQNITFENIPNKTVLDSIVNLVASSSAELTISFKVLSGEAKVVGNQLILNKLPGVVIIEASQKGNEIYNTATPVQVKFEVFKLVQTLTFEPIKSKEYSPDPIDLIAKSSVNLPVNMTVLNGAAEIANQKIKIVKPSKIKILISQPGNEVYYATSDTISFEIFKLNQTIQSQAISYKFTNTAPFAIVAQSTASLPLTFTIKSGPATIQNNMVSSTGQAGLVEILVTQKGDDYYNPTQIELSFNYYQLVGNEPLIKLPQLQVSPNPTNGKLTVATAKGVKSIQIFDLWGRLVAQYPVLIPTNNFEVNIESLPVGRYILAVTNTNNQQFYNSIILQSN